MKQLLNKLVKQKTKINRDIGKVYYILEMNDLSLRITELRNSIIHYKNDKIVLKNRILDFEGLRNNI